MMVVILSSTVVIVFRLERWPLGGQTLTLAARAVRWLPQTDRLTHSCTKLVDLLPILCLFSLVYLA
jgi:hypothetical protein